MLEYILESNDILIRIYKRRYGLINIGYICGLMSLYCKVDIFI